MNNSWIARVTNWMNTVLRPYETKDFKNHPYFRRHLNVGTIGHFKHYAIHSYLIVPRIKLMHPWWHFIEYIRCLTFHTRFIDILGFMAGKENRYLERRFHEIHSIMTKNIKFHICNQWIVWGRRQKWQFLLTRGEGSQKCLKMCSRWKEFYSYREL